MRTISILQAEANFSYLVASIEDGNEQEIIIARNGLPIAKLIPIVDKEYNLPKNIPRKAGVLKGRIKVLDDFDAPLADFAEYQ